MSDQNLQRCPRGLAVWAAFYFVIGGIMCYWIDGAFKIGGFGFMYHYIAGMVIILMAFVFFLAFPDTGKALLLLKYSFILSLVYFIPVIWSVFLWTFDNAPFSEITKGTFYNVYLVLDIMVCAGAVLMFGKRSVLFLTIAMAIGNTIILVDAAKPNPGEFVSELIKLVVTFGEVTEPMVKEVEIHDLTIAFGVLMIYALLDRELYGRWVVFLISLFFSVTGLKRIVFLAAVICVAAYFIVRKLSEKHLRTIVIASALCWFFFTLLYITAIHGGLYDWYEKIGIDTKGRYLIYWYANQNYRMSPLYMGHGYGFSGQAWNVSAGSGFIQDALHNEYLRTYMEIGFPGYLMWFFLYFVTRPLYFLKKQGQKGGALFIILVMFLAFTYLTDNTYYYYYTNMAFFTCVTSGKIEQLSRKESVTELLQAAERGLLCRN